MKIDRRICNMCRKELARHFETCEFMHCNCIDDYRISGTCNH